MEPSPRSPLRSLLRAVLTALLVPVLLFEEWGWAPLAALVGQLARLPLWARLERKVAGLPPWGALLVFVAPVVALFPVKLLALYLFGRGHYTSGLVLLIGAKLAGTAVVARLFQLTLPALMQIPLFARWYPRWKNWKDSVLTAVRQSAPWRAVRALKAGVRRWWRVLLGRTN
ncbi:hypothetical protein ACSFA8_15735 [Variovorax sp. RT4R15]|uniref:hypothetical protein n=1 Tax=Variovorax sp. RT4R15 TaxID=3443737 RepID=UPI003F45412B